MIRPNCTIADIKEKLQILANYSKTDKCHVESVDLFKAGHILALWINSQGLGDNYQKIDDISLIKPFWVLCSKFGFYFTPKERHDLFEHYRRFG